MVAFSKVLWYISINLNKRMPENVKNHKTSGKPTVVGYYLSQAPIKIGNIF